MSRGSLIQAIEKAIGVLQPMYRNSADESDLYEASILTLCLDAARAAGGTTMLTQDGTTPATALRFRRSPGNLWSGTFTYILVSFPGIRKQLEIHLGVYVVAANSKVPHECDVAIIDYKEAERSLAGQGAPADRQARRGDRSEALQLLTSSWRRQGVPRAGPGNGSEEVLARFSVAEFHQSGGSDRWAPE